MSKNLQLTIDGAKLSVRRFSIHEEMSEHFEITVWARIADHGVDLERAVGGPATFVMKMDRRERKWQGAVAHAEQVRAEESGESTYLIVLVPPLWLLTQVRNHRVFQHMTLPDIVDEVLKPYKISATRELTEQYKDREYIVQHGETDYAFVNRLLEEAGIAYFYRFGRKTKLVLADNQQLDKDRSASLPYVDEPNPEAKQDYVTKVRLTHRVRPGKVTIRDHDFRKKPDFPLIENWDQAARKEEKVYEQFHYVPGGMKVEVGGTGPMVADDAGKARHELEVGSERAERWLQSVRRGHRSVSFTSNAMDLAPGTIFRIDSHPHDEIGPGTRLLVNEFTLDGSPTSDWVFSGEAYFADEKYQPALKSQKNRVPGVQSAIVVGPKGEEIHTDEYGRVRVQFHWDREGEGISKGKNSSKWLRVSQMWAGRRFGTMMIPRIGHEVLVRYLEGDPEQPVVVGRVYNKLQPVPYALPKHKIKSLWKSDTSPHQDDAYNEIRMDDRKDLELFYMQAERDREELVRNNEMERTGINRASVVGDNCGAIVGNIDATLVGQHWSLQMIKPPSPKKMKVLEEKQPDVDVTDTKMAMVDKRIIATTSKATMELDKKEIIFASKGEVSLKAGGAVIIEAKKVKINC